ncbi:ERF family protein [Kurthia populi]
MDVNNVEQVQTAGPLNLFQKLVEVRKHIPTLRKDGNGYKYSYVTGSQILAGIQDSMNNLGILLFPRVDTQNVEKEEVTTGKGKTSTQFRVYGKMTYTWINADNPTETLEVPFMYGAINEDVAKAIGSALTYAERYFLIKSFNLPTDNEDPDYNQQNYQQQPQRQYRNQQQPQQQQQPQYQQQTQKQIANADGEKMITAEQKQKLKNALKIVAGPKAEDQQVAYESACYACNIPEGTATNSLIFTQASGILMYFGGLVKQRQQQGGA